MHWCVPVCFCPELLGYLLVWPLRRGWRALVCLTCYGLLVCCGPAVFKGNDQGKIMLCERAEHCRRIGCYAMYSVRKELVQIAWSDLAFWFWCSSASASEFSSIAFGHSVFLFFFPFETETNHVYSLK
ncbi:hypothetical protein Drorol1_Dr00013352 [Drosera rotundifolia]